MLIILPVRNLVLFPGVVLPVAIKREKTVAGAQEAVRAEAKVGFLLQKDPRDRGPGVRRPAPHRHRRDDRPLRHRARRHPPPGLPGRAALPRARRREPASRTSWRASNTCQRHRRARTRRSRRARCCLKQKAVEAITLLPQAPAELANCVQAIESPAALADMIASFLDIKPAEKQELLETADVRERLERVSDAPDAPRRGAEAVAPDRRADQGSDRRTPARDTCCASS